MAENSEATGPAPQGGKPSPRRRFLQGGLAGGSVLLLASTRRALAGGKCGMATKSGYQSLVANPKTSAKSKKFCPGKSPKTWAKGTGWPSPNRPSSTKFTDCFGTGYPPSISGFSSSATLSTCLAKESTSNAACQFAGAYLNAAGGATSYPYKSADIVKFWRDNYHNSSALASYASYFGTYLNVS